MARMKERFNNAWVDSDKVGKVRYLGADVAYGPPAGATYESTVWPQEPVDTDNIDPGQAYNMGIVFYVITAKNCVGVRWRVPDVITDLPPLDDHVVSVWSTVTEERLAFKNFTPVPGGYQDIMFDAPVPLTASVEYVVAVYTRHYVYRSATSAALSPSGNLVSQGGRLVPFNGGPNIYPDGAFNSWYYVSAIVEV